MPVKMPYLFCISIQTIALIKCISFSICRLPTSFDVGSLHQSSFFIMKAAIPVIRIIITAISAFTFYPAVIIPISIVCINAVGTITFKIALWNSDLCLPFSSHTCPLFLFRFSIVIVHYSLYDRYLNFLKKDLNLVRSYHYFIQGISIG